MKIKQLNQDCLELSVSHPQEKRKKVGILINPFGNLKSLAGDIVILTNESKGMPKISGEPFIVRGPGEYEIQGIFVDGIRMLAEVEKDRTVYIIGAEGMRICYWPTPSKSDLSTGQLEKIGVISALLIPIDGPGSLSKQEASKIISQIEPNVIIFIDHSILKEGKGKEKIRGFLKEMGLESIQKEKEVLLKKEDIREDERKFILISSQAR